MLCHSYTHTPTGKSRVRRYPVILTKKARAAGGALLVHMPLELSL